METVADAGKDGERERDGVRGACDVEQGGDGRRRAEKGMGGERFELTWRERSEADPEAVADQVAEDGVERRKFGCRQDVEQVERKRDRLAVAEAYINHRKGEERASISVFKTAHHQRSP